MDFKKSMIVVVRGPFKIVDVATLSIFVFDIFEGIFLVDRCQRLLIPTLIWFKPIITLEAKKFDIKIREGKHIVHKEGYLIYLN